jgi:hypothetical protein
VAIFDRFMSTIVRRGRKAGTRRFGPLESHVFSQENGCFEYAAAGQVSWRELEQL